MTPFTVIFKQFLRTFGECLKSSYGNTGCRLLIKYICSESGNKCLSLTDFELCPISSWSFLIRRCYLKVQEGLSYLLYAQNDSRYTYKLYIKASCKLCQRAKEAAGQTRCHKDVVEGKNITNVTTIALFPYPLPLGKTKRTLLTLKSLFEKEIKFIHYI